MLCRHQNIKSLCAAGMFFLGLFAIPHTSSAASLAGQPCPSDQIGVTQLDTNQTGIVGCFLKEEGSTVTIWKSSFPVIPTTTQRRYVFTSSQTWKVPVGVTSAFITMAGGGSSGFGWRVGNAYKTGHSGGYVFSHPAVLKPDETLTIEVGKGGLGYGPVHAGFAQPGAPYYIHIPPTGDNGLGGYPGTSSRVTSPSTGTILECTGGSGASSPKGMDTLNTSILIPGPQNGATWGSGVEHIASPNRIASGAYAYQDGPGACGPNRYGIGNKGGSSWQIVSGTYAGGMSPFGYGSGGAIHISGCYVTFTTTGTCIWSDDARDGVVIIDVMYQ